MTVFTVNRLSHVRIGTVDEDPAVSAPSLDKMTVCASDDSTLAVSETRAFPCGLTGRYIVVLLEKTEYLTM